MEARGRAQQSLKLRLKLNISLYCEHNYSFELPREQTDTHRGRFVKQIYDIDFVDSMLKFMLKFY